MTSALNTIPEPSVDRASGASPLAPTEAGLETAPSVVMLSVPRIAITDDSADLSTNDLPTELDEPTDVVNPGAVVPLKVPDVNRLQNYVQNARQRFLDFAGCSLYWRMFVGSGFAFLIGALTLLAFGPSAEQVRKLTAQSTESDLTFVDQQAGSESTSGAAAPDRPVAELTVVAHQGDGSAEPAQFDDPFVESNLVSSSIQHAVHRANGDHRTVTVQQVSAQTNTQDGPAWLAGSIEDETDSTPPMRNHERSRPSHR